MHILYVLFTLLSRLFAAESGTEFYVCTFETDVHNYEFLSVESDPLCNGTTGVAYAWIDHSNGRYASCVQWRFTTGDHRCDEWITSGSEPFANGIQPIVYAYTAPMVAVDAQAWTE